ncbi:MAG: response regulator transcription factor [Eggerthella lenta]
MIALLAYAAGEASLALQVLAMLLSGFAMGLAIVRWERSVAGVSGGGWWGAPPLCWHRGRRCCTSCSRAVVRGRAWRDSQAWSRLPCALVHCGFDAQDVVVTRLLTLQTASFLKRYAGAFAALGGGDHVRAHPIASARFAVVSDDTFLVLLLVAPVFLLVLLCAWLPKREQNFMLVFTSRSWWRCWPCSRSPGNADIAQRVCGVLPVVDRVARGVAPGHGIAGESGASALVRSLRPWAGGVLPGRCRGRARGHRVDDDARLRDGGFRLSDGIVKVSVVTSFALIVLFCATNVVLRGSMLRRVELIARGRITQVMPAPRSFSGSEAHGEGDAPDALQDAYRRIAFDRGLTPRELDVLVVLGRGNTLARVQSELVISEGTAITHRRNIYRKLDVHSKQELLDFVERYARA